MKNYVGFCIVFLLLASSAPTCGAAENLSPELFESIARVTAPSQALLEATKVDETGIENHKRDFLSKNSLNDPNSGFSFWHQVTLEILAFDHIPRYAPDGLTKITLEQYGPHRSSYVTAMVHLAMFEVMNLFVDPAKSYKSWLAEHLNDEMDTDWKEQDQVPKHVSESAAIDSAAYEMLSFLYPNYSTRSVYADYDKILMKHLLFECETDCPLDVKQGKELGRHIATTIIKLRSDDNSQMEEPSFESIRSSAQYKAMQPAGRWDMDPVSKITIALGGNWGKTRPFFLFKQGENAINNFDEDPFLSTTNGSTVLAKPPNFGSSEFVRARQMVERQGEDRRHQPMFHFDDRLENFHYYEGKFWSYDGMPSLCAPVRLYNQIADEVLKKYRSEIAPHWGVVDKALGALEVARYYAVVNLAMVDAGIEAWKAKYNYLYWRPVTGVRFVKASQPENGSDTIQNGPLWYPLGAQNTNSASGYNITPPFPAYPSGHSVFGSAFFTVLRGFVPADHGFAMTSDEFRPPEGHITSKSIDAYNFVRCVGGDRNKSFCGDAHHLHEATVFQSFKEAEACNSASRIWLGVHWDFDALNGETLGRAIGKKALTQLQPVGGPKLPIPDFTSPSLEDCKPPPNFIADTQAEQISHPEALHFETK